MESTLEAAASFGLNRHALGTGVYGFEAAPFYPGPLAVEHAGILHAVAHQDIQVKSGTEFALPAGVWVCTQKYVGDGWGLTVAFRPQHLESEIVFMHMNNVSVKIHLGGVFGSGQIIGHSGGIPGVAPGVTAEYSGGAHLHVAHSFDVKHHVFSEYFGKAFTSEVKVWEYGQPLVDGGNSFKRGRTVLIK